LVDRSFGSKLAKLLSGQPNIQSPIAVKVSDLVSAGKVTQAIPVSGRPPLDPWDCD
jgi:hypothetical protein